jgi:hypothetical protein
MPLSAQVYACKALICLLTGQPANKSHAASAGAQAVLEATLAALPAQAIVQRDATAALQQLL